MDMLEQIVLAIAILGILYVVIRSRTRAQRAQARYRIAYAHFGTPAKSADQDLLDKFEGMLPDRIQGVSLLRFSLMNRGEREVPANHFEGPVTITLPAGSRILAAAAVDTNGNGASPDGIAVTSTLNRLEIQPFELPSKTSMIFSIVIEGDASPLDVQGSFMQQERILPLSAID